LEIPAVKEGIYARAARVWADQGIASLRIDYRYNGDSDGEFADSTLTAHVADGLAALDFLADGGKVDPQRLALVGWSMGGAVGAAVAGRTAHDLDALALWAPGSNMAASVTLLFGADKVNEALKAGDTPVTLQLPWAEIQLKAAFFESLFAVDPAAELGRYDGPLFVAVGTNDDTVYPQPISGQVLIDYHPGGGELFVRPMDHVFNAFEGVEQVDELIETTGAFIAGNLK
jgi:pimeloyl-ACP methyl ester carboxylesterase